MTRAVYSVLYVKVDERECFTVLFFLLIGLITNDHKNGLQLAKRLLNLQLKYSVHDAKVVA